MLGLLLRWRLWNVAPYFGALAVVMTRPPRGKAQPFAHMIFAVVDGIASVAIDNESVRRARIKSDRQRSILMGVSGAGADQAIAARNVASKRVRCRTHIGCVHVKKSSRSLLAVGRLARVSQCSEKAFAFNVRCYGGWPD